MSGNESLIEEIPEEIASQIQARLEAGERTRLALSTDITREGSFGEGWLVATDRRLFIVNANGEEGQDNRPVAPPLVEVPLSQVSQVEAHEFFGTGLLEIATDQGEREEIQFSRSLTEKFAEAVSVVEDLVKQVRPEGLKQAAGEEDKTRLKPVRKPRCSHCGRVLPPGAEHCPACLKKGKLLVRVLQYAKPYWHLSLLSFLLTLMLTALGLAPPALMKQLMDRSLSPPPNIHVPMPERFAVLRTIVVALGGVYVLRAVLGALHSRLMGWLGERIMFDVRTQVYEHLQKLSLSFYDRRHLGSIMSRVTNDTSVMNGFIVSGLQNLIINALTLVGIGVILVSMNPKLAVLVMAPAPLLAVGTRVFARRIHMVYRRYWRQVSSLNAALASSIAGVRVVKGFAQEHRENRRFRSRSYDLLRVNMKSVAERTWYYPTMGLISSLGALLIWAVGGPQVLRGELTLGAFTAFTGYMWQFYAPIGVLTEIHNVIQQVATAAERVFEVLDTQPEVADAPNAIEMPRIEGRVEFRNVTFRYEAQEPGDYVLKNISFTAEPGELIGLVGHSGSGKTTLVNLLLRFYDPTEGSVLIDGRDLREVKLRSLREQIGIVLQEPFLFSGTIAENIAYGRPDATREEIIEAAKAANAHRFIIRFPDGYDTEVGESGTRLSGGEKQRISIARAILNNPRILILDEATSAVDTETEQLIHEALDRVMKGRTVFAIAHRLSTLKNANKLVVLDKGEIVEMGTHEELLAKPDGVYRRLVKIQTDLAETVVIPE
ncbi:MAG: ABC transporter transmembrane domain-containing protein [Armatimonadota bacterium]